MNLEAHIVDDRANGCDFYENNLVNRLTSADKCRLTMCCNSWLYSFSVWFVVIV